MALNDEKNVNREKSKLKWLALLFVGLFFLMIITAYLAVYSPGVQAVEFFGTQDVQIEQDNTTPIAVSIISPLESNGGLPVNVQDQTTPPLDLYFIQQTGGLAFLANDTQIDNYSVDVTNITPFIVGDYVGIFEPGGRYYFAELLNISSNTLTFDTPLDFEFSTGDFIVPSSRELNVDGSTTPEYFSIRGAGAGTNITVDITRIILKMTTDNVPDYSKFGDIAGGITNGLVLRKKDGDTRNIFNVKTNADLANLAYDLDILQASNPAQGLNGLICRLTFAGQEKHGVAIRLEPEEELEFVIQDDLEDLVSFRVIGQGHIVQD